MNRPLIMLLAGGTASGKTTLARLLAEREGALHLQHDRYYIDVEDPSTFNYDHPDALDTTRLVEDLKLLRAGQPADVPVYDFKTHRRLPQTERIEPAPLIVVEGILVLWDERLRRLSDLRAYVHADDDVRLARRILRDMKERGRSVQSVVNQYFQTVRPMHRMYAGPSSVFANLPLNGEGSIELELEAIMEMTAKTILR